jgi:hypothetical protein
LEGENYTACACQSTEGKIICVIVTHILAKLKQLKELSKMLKRLSASFKVPSRQTRKKGGGGWVGWCEYTHC